MTETFTDIRRNTVFLFFILWHTHNGSKLSFYDMFEVPILIFVIVVNAYCLKVTWHSAELHSLDYFLVTAQSVFDLVFTGILGMVFYLCDLYISAFPLCYFSTQKAHPQWYRI